MLIYYSIIKKRLHPRVSMFLFPLLVFSCGMYISSTAFLPSSFTMYCTMVSMAAWLDHKEHVRETCLFVSLSEYILCLINTDCHFHGGSWIYTGVAICCCFGVYKQCLQRYNCLFCDYFISGSH